MTTQPADTKSGGRRGGNISSWLPEVPKEFVANGAGARGAPSDTPGPQKGRKRSSAERPLLHETNARRLHTDTSTYPALHSPMPSRGGGRGRGRGQNRSMTGAAAPAVEQQKPHKVHNAPSDLQASKLRFDDMEGLSAPSKRAMKEGFKYEYATRVQIATIQPALAGRDLLARARTGTGKTLGFVLPTIERIKPSAERGSQTAIYAVIVSPTRELASQIANEAKMVCKFHSAKLDVQLIVGGSNRNSEAMRLLRGPNSILVCTPGRFQDHVDNTAGFRNMLKFAKVAILDECDRLLEMGFRKEIVKMLATLPPPGQRQTLLFSATMPTDLKSITGLALLADHDYVDCVGKGATETATLAEQTAAIAPKDEWLPRLGQVISEGTLVPNYKIMVFCTTARSAGFLAEFFRQAGLPGILEIHSRMSQSARTRTSDKFRQSNGNVVMFTSDVSARGVDYPGCTLIVQVGLPSSRETYVHRLGRTARAGMHGKGVLLLCEYESAFLRTELKGLPIELLDLGPMPAPGEVQWADAVAKALSNVSKDSDVSLRAEKCYGAWLGYMNGHLRVLQWTKEQLVQEANLFAEQIGLAETPALMKKTVGKMGLRGVPGLRLQ